jgi:hypothetical protein
MNINKQKLQVQIDDGSIRVVNFATVPSFAETVKLVSGVTDWTQASALAAV